MDFFNILKNMNLVIFLSNVQPIFNDKIYTYYKYSTVFS